MGGSIETRYGVEVFINDSDTITIKQEVIGGTNFVCIHPEFVEAVVKLLYAAKEELIAAETAPTKQKG